MSSIQRRRRSDDFTEILLQKRCERLKSLYFNNISQFVTGNEIKVPIYP